MTAATLRKSILDDHGMYWALWSYTARDELRDRLNDRLQGKEPNMVWNTRHWRLDK